jgi:glycosyltransferase involved in cell wall biosynthesis
VLSGLAKQGHDVALICGGPVADRDYEVVNSGGTYTQYLAAPVICLTRFKRADAVIDVQNGMPFFSPLWRRRPSVCLVHHVHTDQWHGRFPAPIAVVCRLIEKRVMPIVYHHRTFVAISQSTADDLCAIGIPKDHIRIIVSGVDVPVAAPAGKTTEPLFVSLNRLVPHKRVDLLLSAWELVAKEIPGRLVIAGDGPELEHIQKLAADIPRVEVIGRVSEDVKQQLLSEAWFVLSAAHHEGWGMSVMEAAAVGTTALGVEARGTRDTIVDEVTGVLVSAPDDSLPSALAEAWIALASDTPRRSAMAKAARDRANDFSWDKTVDQWAAVLEEVTGSTPHSEPTRSFTAMVSRSLAIGSAGLARLRAGSSERRRG